MLSGDFVYCVDTGEENIAGICVIVLDFGDTWE